MTTYHPNFTPVPPPPPPPNYNRTMSNGAVPPPPPPPPPGYGPAPTGGAEALVAFKDKCEGMWLGWVAYKAGTAFYEMHPDAAQAALHGLKAMSRWWVWLFFFKVWLGSTLFLAWMLYLRFHDVHGESYDLGGLDPMTLRVGMWIIPATIAVLTMYCRNIDFSLLQRRSLYNKVQPLVRKLDSWPNWLLYIIVFFPLMFPFPLV